MAKVQITFEVPDYLAERLVPNVSLYVTVDTVDVTVEAVSGMSLDCAGSNAELTIIKEM